jgi:Mn-dependent DtxR family transcriptional regulator
MPEQFIRDGLLVALAARYTLDSAVAREVIAQLRNEGYVEEQVRGVIRFTPRGYKAYKSEPLTCSVA